MPALAGPQVLVARTLGRARDRVSRDAARTLRELAEEHCDRFILATDDTGALDGRHTVAALTALASALRPATRGAR